MSESKKTPLVSVVIATYQRDASLKTAIESVKAQTYKNWEIILVDDNANNIWNQKVIDILSSSSLNEKIKYIQNKTNQGSAVTRNIGIKSANGEYITFLDDDDIYLPLKIESQVTKMIEANADYSITDLDLYNTDESLSEHRKRDFLINFKKEDLLKFHLMYHLTGTDTMMFKKDYLLKIGGFDPIDIGDEFYLMQKAIQGDGIFSYIPNSYVKAYVHTMDEGLSSGKKKIDGENALFEFKKQFFNSLEKKDRHYIIMRHYAVIGFAYARMKKRFNFFLYGIKAFFTAPISCLRLIINRKI